MKHFLLWGSVLFMLVVLGAACKKNPANETRGLNNRPPIACAGADQNISLPTQMVTLDGRCSTDPENSLLTYQWSKIAGPAPFVITAIHAKSTTVTDLVAGVYAFELSVTDAGGLRSKDTVAVTVNAQAVACGNSNRPQVSLQLLPVGQLSQARTGVSVAAAGNTIVFAGGFIPYATHSSRVDIYDIAANKWSSAELSVGRSTIAAVANGNKVFFGGGEVGDGTWAVDNVDIYDVATKSWTTSRLSIPGNSIVAAAVGDKVLFAGGDGTFSGGWKRSVTVDIYDSTTASWSTATLGGEGKRGGHAAVTHGNKVYIAGGEAWTTWSSGGNWYCSNRIDIYDNGSNTWSAASLREGKLGHAGIAANDRIYWAGGQTGTFPSIQPSCAVEVNDLITGNQVIQHLSGPSSHTSAVMKDNTIAFFSDAFDGGSVKVDLYDISTQTWLVGVLPFPIQFAAVFAVNNTIYLAGGEVNGALSTRVWKLEF